MARTDEQIKVPQLTHEQITERAYQIYLANGCQAGHAEDDWLQAEYELLQTTREAMQFDEEE